MQPNLLYDIAGVMCYIDERSPRGCSCSSASRPAQPDNTRARVLDQLRREHTHCRAVRAHLHTLSPPAQDATNASVSNGSTPTHPTHPRAPRVIVTLARRRRHRGPRPTPLKDGFRLQNRWGGLQGGNARQAGGEDGGTWRDGRDGRVLVVDVSIVLHFPFFLTLAFAMWVVRRGAGSPRAGHVCATSPSASNDHHVHVTR
ncbi:hypothetical protein OG21DRAFT_1059700 [Imleria badia]|nr:hypothetical protein OG21DRAFT_1059700 [Imleria badia]